MLHARAANYTKKQTTIFGHAPNEEMDLIVTNGFLELEEALKKWKTPIAVTKALMHGIRNWRQCQKGLGTAIEWPGDDVITRNTDRDTADELVQKLMAAFASQSTIGWKNMFSEDL
jgi:hypothetical protein